VFVALVSLDAFFFILAFVLCLPSFPSANLICYPLRGFRLLGLVRASHKHTHTHTHTHTSGSLHKIQHGANESAEMVARDGTGPAPRGDVGYR
jgi:hypothetical protein